jgi:hypothetical protein
VCHGQSSGARGQNFKLNQYRFALFLAPRFADMILPAMLLSGFIGESSLCLWLIVKGVNVPKWEHVKAGSHGQGFSDRGLLLRPQPRYCSGNRA